MYFKNRCTVLYVAVQSYTHPEGPVNDGYNLGKRQLNISITGPPRKVHVQMCTLMYVRYDFRQSERDGSAIWTLMFTFVCWNTVKDLYGTYDLL
jgi:hypothetical protein